MKKFSPIMICNLVLMILLLAFSLVCVVMIFGGLKPAPAGYSDAEKLAWNVYGAVNAVNILALACGIVYICKGYSKQAAGFYKAFMFFLAVASIPNIVINVLLGQDGSSIIHSLPISIAIMVLKAAILLIFVFWKDLGRRNTWILFAVLLVLDVIYGFLFSDISGIRAFRVVTILSRLVTDGTIALAINGKFTDKVRRGRKV